MTLVLHRGAAEVSFDDLRQVQLPAATDTHFPIAHSRLVEMLRHSLTFYNHEITEEHHAITPDGMRYFGLVKLKSTYGDYTDTAILRNSNDRAFATSVGYGACCFCCDNLSFHAEYVIRRKHTANALRDIHGLMAELVEPLALERQQQHEVISRYKLTNLSEEIADHAIMSLYREGVINVNRIPDVLDQWREPKYQEWLPGTAWHLFNSVTYALAGKVAENPDSTKALHRIIDGVIEAAH